MVGLAIVAWGVAVALVLALAFLLLVGRAFQFRSAPGDGELVKLLLGPGLLLARGNPLAVVLVSWLTWFALGAGAIVLFARGG